MKTSLYNFQKEDSAIMAANPHFMNGSEPGTGKTITSIAASEIVGARRNLVVAPASLCPQWREVLNYELGLDSLTWKIISYNKANDYARYLQGSSTWFDALILDEAHFLKTSDSQRTCAIFHNDYGLARRAHYKWPLTGTPVLNRPRELYPVLSSLGDHLISPYNTYSQFTQRWCGAYWEGPGRGINDRGASRTEELAERLSKFMVRRTLAEVMPELPPQIVTRIPVTLSRADEAILLEAEREIENRESFISTTMEDFSQLGDSARLQRAVGEAKVNCVVQFVNDLLRTVDKVVVFAWHRDVIHRLRDEFAKSGHRPVIHYGGLSDKVKTQNKNNFVGDPMCKVFIGNIKSSGTGLDGLQKVCNTGVFAELSWTPGEMDQCVGRMRRIGAMASTAVNAYIPHVPGSIESAILGSHDGKIPVINRLVGDGRKTEARSDFAGL